MNNHVKILFRIDGSSPEEQEVESLWALRGEDGYVLDNIPFYARDVACGDVVEVDRDSDGALWYSGLIRPSGHSTVRLWFAESEQVEPVREQLQALGCSSEVSELSRLVAVDIPPEITYDAITAFLDEKEADGVFEYEEACVGSRPA